MSRAYKIYSSSSGTLNGAASIKITKAGRIKAILFSLGLLGGAGVARMNYEISKQNTISNTTNDTPETVIASAMIASPNATHNAENALVVCDIPIQVGDTIYLNIAMTGAVAPASAECQIYLYV